SSFLPVIILASSSPFVQSTINTPHVPFLLYTLALVHLLKPGSSFILRCCSVVRRDVDKL
ncbi:hypothetical protein M378DRAFT_163649, partial [Amanita muscaria Koide BX008]